MVILYTARYPAPQSDLGDALRGDALWKADRRQEGHVSRVPAERGARDRGAKLPVRVASPADPFFRQEQAAGVRAAARNVQGACDGLDGGRKVDPVKGRHVGRAGAVVHEIVLPKLALGVLLRN